jgi:hypothetical protein|tara:strand:- start:2087 stop:2302 length:216 start_codon:yes stop_codon:yes gene_type:complete
MSDVVRYETDNDSYDRDPNSMALINTDRNAFELYKSRRKDAIEAKTLHNDVEKLKSDIGEIKELLQNLVRG